MQNNEAEKIELELELPEGEVDVREADVDTSLPDTIQQEATVEEIKTDTLVKSWMRLVNQYKNV